MNYIFWNKLKLVIFDVDGTLYDQSKLRRIMFVRLILYYSLKPWKYRDILVLYHFRKERENRPGFIGEDIENEQFEWCAKKMNLPEGKVKMIVNKWIFEQPNRHLKKCMYPGVAQFFNDLKDRGIGIAVYSDYDAGLKLKSMHLDTDMEMSSTDKKVNRFKPEPRGLLVILAEMQIIDKSTCLFIGDRFELDGKCAENAGVPFLLVNKETAGKSFYKKLSSELIDSTN